MFITEYGAFNGNTWENMFQVVLKSKYMPVGYQRIPATPGDFGLEGFTKDGKCFQCYCPEMNDDNRKLYERQRDKITEDINKLKTNNKEILRILGDVKIKTWTLITPYMGHNDLLAHCNAKKELVKSWNLPFIDNENFEVLVHESTDYSKEIGEYLGHSNKKISFQPLQDEITDEILVQWKESKIELVKNAYDKNEVRIKSLNMQFDIDKRTNALTHESARSFLNGESILRVWKSTQPENHQRFIELVLTLETELREKCLLRIVNPNEFIESIKNDVEIRIKSSFSYLDDSTVVRLKNYCIAYWLMGCPLYFEEITD